MFLEFVNFYRRFIYCYFKIAASLIDLLKDNKNEKNTKSFVWFKNVERAFRELCDIFMFVSLLCHFDLVKKIWVETDVFNFAIIDILNQQNDNKNWRSITFWSRKMISTKQNYKTHDQELLTIVVVFK